MEFSRPKIKKFLYFIKKSFSYILGNGTFVKKLSELEKNKKPTMKKCLIFSGNGTF